MSYCRFSSADIYLFSHVDGYISCCACSLAPKVKSIFTVGYKDGEHPLFNGHMDPCDNCDGKGCDRCMISGETVLSTYDEAIRHVRDHIANGDYVPDDVIPRLEFDKRIDDAMKSSRFRRHKAMVRHKKKIEFRKAFKRMKSGKRPRVRRFTVPVRGITKKSPGTA